MPVFFSFAQVREDLAHHTAGISQEQLWKRVAGNNSLGFHLKHIAGSIHRLTTYLASGALTAGQLEFLQNELTPTDSLPHLLALIESRLHAAEQQLLKIDPATLYEPRSVGRQALPTTVLGLLVHMAEHTQRHLGQAILISRLLQTS
jgi:uncharacterized damage-inducible protein DinB